MPEHLSGSVLQRLREVPAHNPLEEIPPPATFPLLKPVHTMLPIVRFTPIFYPPIFSFICWLFIGALCSDCVHC